MLRRLYARLIERGINVVPNHIMIVADKSLIENFEKFLRFLEWSKKFGIGEMTVCFPNIKKFDLDKLKTLDFRVRVVSSENVSEFNREKDKVLNLIFGYKGKDEIIDAVRKIAVLVEQGMIDPEEVDETFIEKFLVVKSPPDLIVKVGNELPEFLIWQSIYSELYFADVEIESFRYIDFLRCLREFQRRERRYGR